MAKPAAGAGEFYKRVEVFLVPSVNIEPNINSRVSKKLVYQCYGEIEGARRLTARVAWPVSAALIVILTQTIERYLHLPNPVPLHEFADIIWPCRAISDDRR